MDIVERLRLRPEREMLYIDGCVAAGYGPTIEAQAADEIERLRELEQRWRNEYADAMEQLRQRSDECDVLRNDLAAAQAHPNDIRIELSAQRLLSERNKTNLALAEQNERLKSDLAAARALLRDALAAIEVHATQRTFAGGVVLSNTAIKLRAALA